MVKSARNPVKRKQKSGKKSGRRKERTVSIWWILSPLLLCIGASLGIAALVMFRDAEKGATVPKGNYDYALDISKYQRDVNWDSLMVITDATGRTVQSIEKASSIRRIRYIMIKATEGERHTDRLFKDHWEKSAAAGYGRGAYHFFRSSKSGAVQAENFIRTVGPLRHSDLAPILDVETVHRGCSREQLNSGIGEWLETVERHYRRKPIIYTSDSFLKDWLSPEIVRDYPVWIARYSDEAPVFDAWVFWQFTDRAAVYGIPSPCDLSVIKKGG
ncbi:MAG: glycoside hydrolase family 25 protein [Candidatus Cryptobacteroides sp.]